MSMKKLDNFNSESNDNVRIIKKILSDDKKIIDQFYNIGIYPGNQIYICDYSYNKKIVHIIVDNIQYAIRLSDAQKIILDK